MWFHCRVTARSSGIWLFWPCHAVVLVWTHHGRRLFTVAVLCCANQGFVLRCALHRLGQIFFLGDHGRAVFVGTFSRTSRTKHNTLFNTVTTGNYLEFVGESATSSWVTRRD